MKSQNHTALLGLACVLVLFLSGCATLPSVDAWTVDDVAEKTAITRDDFQKATTVKSPVIIFARENTIDIYQYHLTAIKLDGEETAYYLSLFSQRGSGRSWAFWSKAADENGQQFEMQSIARNVMKGGIVHEHSSARLTREYLDSITHGNIKWRVYGQRAVKEFVISPNLVEGFLKRCRET